MERTRVKSKPSILAEFVLLAIVFVGPVQSSLAQFEVHALTLQQPPADARAGEGEAPASGGTGGLNRTELAKQEQSPLSRLVRLQMENNVQFGFGPDDELINFLRLQPSFPFDLSDEWTVIVRGVVPIIYQEFPENGTGVGDIGLQLLFTRRRNSRLLWGAGPAFTFPTATGDIIGTEKWTAGPAGAIAYMSGPWVAGGVVSQVWSYAGDDDRSDVNAMSIRPFVNYNMPGGWFLTSAPGIVANWEADSDNRWLVPVGGGAGKVIRIHDKLLIFSLEGYYHVESPEIGPDWQLRVQLTFLFPK